MGAGSHLLRTKLRRALIKQLPDCRVAQRPQAHRPVALAVPLHVLDCRISGLAIDETVMLMTPPIYPC